MNFVPALIPFFPAWLISTNPALVIVFLPILLFSLTFHEAAHAWMAARLGDPTAKFMGRLTLNPMAHLDIFGTLMLFLSDFRFGWAKPVPIDPRNFADYKRGIFLTAAAGPASNIVLAFGCGLIIRVLVAGMDGVAPSAFSETLLRMFSLGLIMNLALAFFNLIPLPPLDGSKILYGLAPSHWEAALFKLERMGPMLLMVLIFSGVFFGVSLIWLVIGPLVKLFTYALSGVPLQILYAFVYG